MSKRRTHKQKVKKLSELVLGEKFLELPTENNIIDDYDDIFNKGKYIKILK